MLESALSVGWSGATHENMIVEARIKLGAMLLAAGKDEAAARVRASLEGIEADVLQKSAADLLGAARVYHEVTDRQVDVRWIAPELRGSVDRFVALCTGG